MGGAVDSVRGKPDEALKQEVHDFWNSRPCGTQFTQLVWGSREFFDAVEGERYLRQPFMEEAVGFKRYPGKRLLEIGCGLGTDTLQFARGGAIVTGVDLTEQSVELARRRFEMYGVPGTFLVADAERLPFPDASFDVVYSFGVLHHTPDTGRAIDEVYRVLEPGGEIVIMLYHSHSTHLWLGYPVYIAKRLRQGKGPRSFEEYFRVYDGEENPLGKAYTAGEVRQLFHRFEDLKLTTYDPYRPRLPGFLNRILTSVGRRYGFWLLIRGRKPGTRR
jgi:ubiquinone/menaquinone biosynthesis C-methylase UbiE